MELEKPRLGGFELSAERWVEGSLEGCAVDKPGLCSYKSTPF
jgi:hypothetical protein